MRKTVVLEAEIESLKKSYTDDVPQNAEGILGYEQTPEGDGTWGFYFNDPDLTGNAQRVSDEDIDFEWNGGRPLTGISHENFGVRWETWVKAPVSG